MNREQIKLRTNQILEELNKDGADVTALDKELRELQANLETIEKREALIAKANKLNANPTLGESRGTFSKSMNPVKPAEGDPKIPEKRDFATIRAEKREERGVGLKNMLDQRTKSFGHKDNIKLRMLDMGETDEERVVTVGNSTVVLPTAFADDITDVFNQVSMLVDMVQIMPLMGGESYQKPFVNDYGIGGETALIGNATDVETTFNYAVINKSKITAYQTWPREITKLANAPYEMFITRGINIALRKRLNRQIMFGDGTANNLVGIFSTSANLTAIDDTNDIDIASITDTTLDTIVFDYGGDEDVEMGSYLLLNKRTLRAWAQVRTAEDLPFYKITMKGNTGTLSRIDDSLMVDFIINSAIPELAASTTTTGDFVMAYGDLKNYEMAIFSDAEIMRSDDFLFKTGQIAYRGEVYAGGNVTKKDGFLRFKKA